MNIKNERWFFEAVMANARVAKHPVPVVTNRHMAIAQREYNPHYTDKRFNDTQTIYLENGYKLHKNDFGGVDTVNGAHYVYSDRISYDERNRGYDFADTLDLTPRSAIYLEAMLCEAFGYPIVLAHIVAGVNVSNGYSYHVYGIIERK